MKERVGEDRERYFHHPHVSLIAANKAVSVDYLPDKQPHARQLPKDARRNWNRYCIHQAREPSTPIAPSSIRYDFIYTEGDTVLKTIDTAH